MFGQKEPFFKPWKIQTGKTECVALFPIYSRQESAALANPNSIDETKKQPEPVSG